MVNREKELEEYHEMQAQMESLGRVLKRRIGELVKMVICKDECIHIGQEMPEYENSFRPVCRKTPRPEHLPDGFISPQDCAVCPLYERNLAVKFSVFMKYDYEKKRFL